MYAIYISGQCLEHTRHNCLISFQGVIGYNEMRKLCSDAILAASATHQALCADA